MKLIPASSARWMIRIDSSWAELPQAPKFIVPRQSGLTWTPVAPSGRYFMRSSLSAGLQAARSAADLGHVFQPDYPWRPLGRLLVEEGLVAEADLDAALAEQQ